MATKYRAIGSKLQVEIASVYTDVPSVFTLKPPAGNVDEIDVTTLDSNSSYKEFLPSWKDAGECTVGILFDPANSVHTEIRTIHANQTTVNWKVILPGSPGGTWSFAGFIKQFEFGDLTPDGRVELNFSVRVSGAPTFA